jgi:hypothetical protein
MCFFLFLNGMDTKKACVSERQPTRVCDTAPVPELTCASSPGSARSTAACSARPAGASTAARTAAPSASSSAAARSAATRAHASATQVRTQRAHGSGSSLQSQQSTTPSCTFILEHRREHVNTQRLALCTTAAAELAVVRRMHITEEGKGNAGRGVPFLI